MGKVELGYKIKQIKTVSFSSKELEQEEFNGLLSEKNRLIIDVTIDLKTNNEDSLMIFDVNSKMYNTEPRDTLVSHTGRTVFEIKDFNTFFDKEKNVHEIPANNLMLFYSLAYTHARALLCVEIAPTIYRDGYILPVINPSIFIQDKIKELKGKHEAEE
jgi:hypothetical protein